MTADPLAAFPVLPDGVAGCHHFAAGRCRSCGWLPQPYPEQLARKQQAAAAALAAWPALHWLPPLASAPFGFRNKAKMVVSGRAGRPVLGIRDDAGRPVALIDCPLYPPSLQRALDDIGRWLAAIRIAPYDIDRRVGELKYVLLTQGPDGGLLLRFVLRSEAAVPLLRRTLPDLRAAVPALRVISANLQPEPMAILEGPTEILLDGAPELAVPLGALTLHLRPQAFFQTHTALAAALYAQARDWLAEEQPAQLWDLYCGVGGFALHLAAVGRAVTGVEREPAAIDAARRSAAQALAAGIPGSDGLRFIVADAAEWAAAQPEVAEAVVVNPPRRGLGPALCATLDAAAGCRWLLYSSCNVTTLARDLAALPAFTPRKARLLDLFPNTAHGEVIVLAERRPTR